MSTVAICLGAFGVALAIVIAGVAAWTWVQDQKHWPKKDKRR